MKLITNCDSCKEDLKVSALMVENRIDLAKRKGKEFELRCKSCGHYNHVHVDDVKAIDGLSVKLVWIILDYCCNCIDCLFLAIWIYSAGFVYNTNINYDNSKQESKD
jgi:Fe-S-cluster-containing hydrogenase component 2